MQFFVILCGGGMKTIKASLGEGVFAISEMETMPLEQLIRYIYPDFHGLDELFLSDSRKTTDGEAHLVEPSLSAEKFDSRFMFSLDCGPEMSIYIGSNVVNYPLVKGGRQEQTSVLGGANVSRTDSNLTAIRI